MTQTNGSVKAPKFNINRMNTCIILSMDMQMAKLLLSMLQEFEDSELDPAEYAMKKQLGELVNSYISR